ncbi:hypothetical protein CPC08DRAFT_302889 [Agrocybe pediades]|nr:hypothetical protein CPC08DRAFT_302889 [Agrocybe pediades]
MKHSRQNLRYLSARPPQINDRMNVKLHVQSRSTKFKHSNKAQPSPLLFPDLKIQSTASTSSSSKSRPMRGALRQFARFCHTYSLLSWTRCFGTYHSTSSAATLSTPSVSHFSYLIQVRTRSPSKTINIYLHHALVVVQCTGEAERGAQEEINYSTSILNPSKLSLGS